MEALTFILVEDDQTTCNNFIKYTDDSAEIILLDYANTSVDALLKIQSHLPDAVVLDLELHLGGGSGLDVLYGIKELCLDKTPYILITTNNSSNTTYEAARQLGADFIMSKHQVGYSESYVLNFLKMMKSAIKSREGSSSGMLTTESPDLHKKRLLRQITSEINLVGISPKVIGHQYLVDAIYLAIHKNTPNLASAIAQKHGKTESSVVRAMQAAIDKAWRTTDIEELLARYTARIHSDKGTPTVTEFVYYYADKIRNNF